MGAYFSAVSLAAAGPLDLNTNIKYRMNVRAGQTEAVDPRSASRHDGPSKEIENNTGRT